MPAVPHNDTSDADAAGLRRDLPEVGGVARRPGDVDLDAGGGAVDQADGGPRRQDGFALRGADDAFVGDVAADQIDTAASRRADFALVDDVAGAGSVVEQFAAGEEVFVADVERAGDEAGGVDPSAGADHDAGRVHQPDLAVGAERAVDRRRVVEHPVEHGAGGGRLGEVGGLPGLDRELVPVDDGAVAVGHRQPVAGLVEVRRAVHHHRVDRVRLHRCRQ